MAQALNIRTALIEKNVGRGLAGFQTRIAPELHPTGIAELDEILCGGFPRGSVVEICGPVSSGRTSLSLSLLAQATGRQEICALVDVSDSLDPTSLVAAGVDASRLLWIRCGSEREIAKPALAAEGKPERITKECDLSSSAHAEKKENNFFFWQHPRDQMRGLEDSIPSLMAKKGIGKSEFRSQERQAQTGSPFEKKRIHAVPERAQEQVESDRQSPRRGSNVRPRLFSRERVQQNFPFPPKHFVGAAEKPWKRLEQALKTTDLLLQSNGWGVVIFDLGNISWVHARRIPLSTWFRFRRIVENTPTILLLLGEQSCAKSCASVVLQCRRTHESWGSAAYTKKKSGIATFQGFEVKGEIARSRMQLHSSPSACWQTRSIWTDRF